MDDHSNITDINKFRRDFPQKANQAPSGTLPAFQKFLDTANSVEPMAAAELSQSIKYIVIDMNADLATREKQSPGQAAPPNWANLAILAPVTTADWNVIIESYLHHMTTNDPEKFQEISDMAQQKFPEIFASLRAQGFSGPECQQRSYHAALHDVASNDLLEQIIPLNALADMMAAKMPDVDVDMDAVMDDNDEYVCFAVCLDVKEGQDLRTHLRAFLHDLETPANVMTLRPV